MADNSRANTGAGGDLFRTLDDGTEKWPAAAIAYVTGGSAGAWTLAMVDSTHGLPIQPMTGATFAITAASLPLPSGAATAAKQPALGTAGTASADVITVQGIASMTALKVDGSAVTQPVSGTVTANAGTGTFNNQQSNITLDYDTGAGTQTMTIFGIALPASGGAVAGGTATNPLRVDPTGTTTQPVSGTVTANAGTGTFAISGTVTANAGTNLNTSALALESGGNLATLASGVIAQASTTSGQKGELVMGAVTTAAPTYTTAQTNPLSLTTAGALRVDNSAVTQPVSGTVSITANSSVNVNQFGGSAVVTGVGAGGAGIPRVTLSNDSLVQPIPGTTNGLTISRVLSAASTNATSVKASAGMVYAIYATNTNAAARFLKLYNKASAPTVGTDTPVLTFLIPGNTAGAGFALNLGGMGAAFATGIALAITGAVTDADTTAVAANEVVVNLFYK